MYNINILFDAATPLSLPAHDNTRIIFYFFVQFLVAQSCNTNFTAYKFVLASKKSHFYGIILFADNMTELPFVDMGKNVAIILIFET